MDNNSKLDEIPFFLIEKMMKRSKESTMSLFRKHNIDITKDQWVILKKVSEEPGVNQKEVAFNTIKDPASITRSLDILVKKGYISKEVNDKNRREHHLNLTAKGEALVDKTFPLVLNLRDASFKGFSSKDIQQLNTYIKKIYDNLE